MSQRTRILVAVGILLVVVGVVVGVEFWRSRQSAATLEPGSVPIYLDGRLIGGFREADQAQLTQTSFVDAEEGKTQEGWALRDVLLLYLKPAQLKPETRIVVSSSSRNKSATLTWAEVDDPANHVMFDLSGRSTLKLVSTLERLDVRDEWVQDVDKIEIVP